MAAHVRYRRTAKGLAAARRYRAGKGRRVTKRNNQRRIFAGGTFMGRADAALVPAIHAHIKERVSAFKQRQSNREKAQGASPS
jgi:hypothetical protein